MKKGKILLSGLLSLAAFSIFTNVNAEGIGYVLGIGEAPETFTTRETGRVNDALQVDENKDAVLANRTIATLNQNSGNNVIDYHSTTGLKPFCIDRNSPYVPGKTYIKDKEIDDAGIKYIVTLASNYYSTELPEAQATANVTVDVVKKMELSWMTQIAIWQYLDPTFTITDIDPTIREEGLTTEYIYSSRAKLLWETANKLVTDAKNGKGNNLNEVEKLEFTFEGGYELNKDTKTIKTGIIRKSVDQDITMDFSKAPEGVKIFDVNGTELNKTEPISAKEFYLEFPIDNVDNYSFDFDVSASATTGFRKAYSYKTTEGNYQPLVLVELANKQVNGAINFKGSHIDDTASIISRSIYFVGFLILIAGVGMIYINVKPKKEQEI